MLHAVRAPHHVHRSARRILRALRHLGRSFVDCDLPLPLWRDGADRRQHLRVLASRARVLSSRLRQPVRLLKRRRRRHMGRAVPRRRRAALFARQLLRREPKRRRHVLLRVRAMSCRCGKPPRIIVTDCQNCPRPVVPPCSCGGGCDRPCSMPPQPVCGRPPCRAPKLCPCCGRPLPEWPEPRPMPPLWPR